MSDVDDDNDGRIVVRSGLGRWKGRVPVVSLLMATITLSGCVAGAVVRQSTWDRDPSSFWVVMRDAGEEEEGECTVVFDTVLMDAYRSSFSVSNLGPPISSCENASPRRVNEVKALVLLEGDVLKRLDLPEPKSTRRGPEVIYENDWATLEKPRAPSMSFSIRLYGTRFGQSPFCSSIRVDVERLRFIHNAGVDRDVHVMVGEGTRSCSSM